MMSNAILDGIDLLCSLVWDLCRYQSLISLLTMDPNYTQRLLLIYPWQYGSIRDVQLLQERKRQRVPKNQSENCGNDRKDQLTIRWAGAEKGDDPKEKEGCLASKTDLSTSGDFLNPIR